MRAGQFITGSIRLVRQLGEGGMGSVWLAEHLTLHTQVAVKFVVSSLADNPEALARFEREASLSARAKSPHVVQIFDYGQTPDGGCFIVMELLEGEDLAARIRRTGPVDFAEFVEVFRQAASGIGRAHSKGIVHRDIKPENIFLSDDDGETLVKVLDFGIAKSQVSPPSLSSTATGAVIGTGYYLSPEQSTASRSIDFRTDLWSLGVVAYYALTGTRPFDADSWGGLVLAVNSQTFTPPSQRNLALPKGIDSWMAKALAHAPGGRFQSAKAMAEELLGVLRERESHVSAPSSIEAKPRDSAQTDLTSTTLSPSVSEARSMVKGRTTGRNRVFGVAAVLGTLVSGAVGWTMSQASPPERRLGSAPAAAVAPLRAAPPQAPQAIPATSATDRAFVRDLRAAKPETTRERGQQPRPKASPGPQAGASEKLDKPNSISPTSTQPVAKPKPLPPNPKDETASAPPVPKRPSPLDMPFK